MTMNFETIRDSVVAILEAAEGTDFQTISFQRQRKAASEVKGDNRFVQVFYNMGSFPATSGALNGPYKHAITFQLDFTVSQPAKVNLSVLKDDDATAADKITALAAMQEGAYLADRSLDELFRLVYQIIMQPANITLNLEPDVVTSRYINNFQKDTPVPNGELVILTGSATLTCQTQETAEGPTLDVIADPTLVQTLTSTDIETELLEDTTSQTVLETT